MEDRVGLSLGVWPSQARDSERAAQRGRFLDRLRGVVGTRRRNGSGDRTAVPPARPVRRYSGGLAGLILVVALLVVGAPAPAGAAGTGYLFVSSEKDNLVTVLDGRSLDKVQDIPTGDRPRGMRFSPDHKRLYVACGDSDRIDVIDVATLKVSGHLEVGEDPERFDLSPDGRLLYVSNEDDALLTVFDLRDGSRVREIEVGEEPEGVLASPDGRTVYVTSEVANMVHVIDTGDWAVRANVVVGNRPRRLL